MNKYSCKQCAFYAFEKEGATTHNLCKFMRNNHFIIDRKKRNIEKCGNFKTVAEWKKHIKALLQIITVLALITVFIILVSLVLIKSYLPLFTLILPLGLLFWVIYNHRNSRRWKLQKRYKVIEVKKS